MEIYFKRQTVISFPDNPSLDDITTGIADGSLMIDEVLFTDRFTVGTCNSNRFECDLYDFDTIGNEKIYVYQNVWDSAEDITPTEVPLFTGYVDSCITNRGRLEDSKHIVAYDSLQKYANIDVAAWWEEIFESSTTKTVKQLRESLCDFVGIDYESITLPNDDVVIRQTQQINKASFIAMLTYIMEVNACNANVDRNGILRFITLSRNNPIAIDTTYAQNTTEFDDYTIPTFATVRVTNSTENVVATTGGETNYLDITDNVLLLDKTVEELQPIVNTILVNVNSVTYYPATIDMIVSNLNIQVGDRVTIDNKTYIVCEQTLYGSQFVDQQINSIGQRELEESASTYDATQRDMQNKIDASSLKYYKFQNLKALEFTTPRKILDIRYTSADDGLIIFHGCVIMDIERINTSQPAIIEIRYTINKVDVREYTPTEYYYHDGRYTYMLMHYWEAMGNRMEHFSVTMTPTNCKITIGAFKEEGYMEGMGLVGDGIWDGVIEFDENVGEITFATTPETVDYIGDELDVSIHTNPVIEIEDEVGEITFATTPGTVDTIHEQLYVNKQRMSAVLWADLLEYTWEDVEDNFLW